MGLVLLVGAQAVNGQQPKKEIAFGSLESMNPDTARTKAAAWLKTAGKTDAASLQRFDSIWKQEERTVLDRLTETFTIGSDAAAKLMKEVRNPLSPAPVKAPELLTNAEQPIFFRANLALAYARALCNRRIHEEALDVLKLFQAEQVAEPSTYLFHRGVCEHALLQRVDADKSVTRLLADCIDAAERHKTVALLMLLDMQGWKDKDLGAIARKMENIERRLELARAGEKTQKMQKEVVLRLDELIKELENKAKKNDPKDGPPSPDDCPSGAPMPGGDPKPGEGPPQGGDPKSPATQSGIANNGGSGKVDPAKLQNLAQQWGQLLPHQRDQIMQELTAGMSARHREAIENYFRNIAAQNAAQKR
jgi:hypothetical protein